MRITTTVQITASMDRQLQEQILASAYRLSRTGTVGLRLAGVERAVIDRFMDRIVAQEGTNVAGILYLDDVTEAA